MLLEGLDGVVVNLDQAFSFDVETRNYPSPASTDIWHSLIACSTCGQRRIIARSQDKADIEAVMERISSLLGGYAK